MAWLINQLTFLSLQITRVFSSLKVLIVVYLYLVFLCPQLQRSWPGILVSGCASVHASVCSSRTMHARVLKFHIWHMFFFSCPSYLLFWSYAPLKKIGMKSDACHILRTVHVRVLKFHIWITHGKIADQYFFSCQSCLPFWSYAPLKKTEQNLVS